MNLYSKGYLLSHHQRSGTLAIPNTNYLSISSNSPLSYSSPLSVQTGSMLYSLNYLLLFYITIGRTSPPIHVSVISYTIMSRFSSTNHQTSQVLSHISPQNSVYCIWFSVTPVPKYQHIWCCSLSILI